MTPETGVISVVSVCLWPQFSVCTYGTYNQTATKYIKFNNRHCFAFLPQELLHSVQSSQSRLLRETRLLTRPMGCKIGKKRKKKLFQMLCAMPLLPFSSSNSGCFSATSSSATQSCHSPLHHHCKDSATHTQLCHIFPPFVTTLTPLLKNKLWLFILEAYLHCKHGHLEQSFDTSEI